MSFDWRVDQSQTIMEFVQATDQAVMEASYWLKLEHCSSTD